MTLWKMMKCIAPTPLSFFSHSSSLPAQQIKKRINKMVFSTTFHEIQIRRCVPANNAALSTLEPSDDKVEKNSAHGDGPVHHQSFWDATEARARNLDIHSRWFHPTGRVLHGSGWGSPFFCNCNPSGTGVKFMTSLSSVEIGCNSCSLIY